MKMLLNFCKSCQYCLETMYWNCCEERFCFDEKIATYKLDDGVTSVYANGITNMGASLESVVTQQPHNNNHLPPTAVVGREVKEMPIHADKIYEVFSKSLIFREDHELKSKGSLDTLDDIETKSEPDYLSDRPNRTKVYFEDEVDSPVTDFEIMFKDELLASYDMFKIDEEEEDRKSQEEEGLTMSVSVKKQNVIKPSTVTLKGEPKMTTPNSIYQYDPISVVQLPTNLTLPRVESVKGILRQKSDINRSDSVRTLDRVDSNKLLKSTLNRVESLKNIDPNKINKVLARVPHRSASFLNIPEHLTPTKPPLMKSKSTVGVTSLAEHELKLSQLPDTPIIRSNNLPRFFADSPSLPEYKGETSLQSIKQKTALMFKENDFSMPRYYGGLKPLEPPPVHESKSMPDLRNPTSNVKASKRLVKLRSKLKPLVIRKSSDERV
ncbi:PREDICTED: uncharacterized protein LOC106115290 [Papilio xuthus]|uniref:Uncharacterized protein LOC106115290 n=1 Tax=Papilio xuthus TaxID=66420 RepID=A0AAJ6Z2P3_PAPXU|nr:PREDICTED: uncharacterized protein LOC106115290 [Papilio xuthus]XP_013164110.1 PREDICTED: uncharacterized protein LOC106115290 [Papilio xuthus]